MEEEIEEAVVDQIGRDNNDFSTNQKLRDRWTEEGNRWEEREKGERE